MRYLQLLCSLLASVVALHAQQIGLYNGTTTPIAVQFTANYAPYDTAQYTDGTVANGFLWPAITNVQPGQTLKSADVRLQGLVHQPRRLHRRPHQRQQQREHQFLCRHPVPMGHLLQPFAVRPNAA